MKNLNIPNTITFIRLLMLIPFFFFLINNNKVYAIFLFVLFVILDAVDGTIARRLNQETVFGKNFDFIVDVLLGVVIVLTQLFTHKIPTLIWILAFVNGFIQIILVSAIFIKTKKFQNSRIKEFASTIYYLFLFLLILNIYNTFTYILFYLLLALMFYYNFDYYYYEVREVYKS